MGYEALAEYDFFLKFQDKALEKVGFDASIFIPKQQITLGYKDLCHKWVEQWTGVKDITNSFSMFTTKIYMEFNIKRGVFYHFNLNPEDEDNKQLVQIYMSTNSLVREGSFIRTTVSGGVSVWGILYFRL